MTAISCPDKEIGITIENSKNDFHILEFEESEKILFEKFKEEDVQKYRKQ